MTHGALRWREGQPARRPESKAASGLVQVGDNIDIDRAC